MIRSTTSIAATFACICLLAADSHAQAFSPRLKLRQETTPQTSSLMGAVPQPSSTSATSSPWIFLPARAGDVFEGPGKETLSGASISGWNKRASVYTELVYDYFGPIRGAIGTTLASAEADDSSIGLSPEGGTNEVPAATGQTSSQIEAIQRLIGGGGNFVLSGIYPALLYDGDSVQAHLFLNPRLGLDPPNVGQSTSNFLWNLDLGSEFEVCITGEKKKLQLFLQTRMSYIVASSKFQDASGIGDQKFPLGTVVGGVRYGPFEVAVSSVVIAPSEIKDAISAVTATVSLVKPKSDETE